MPGPWAGGGFRADWTPDNRDRLTFMGDFYDGQEQVLLSTASLTAPFTSTMKDRLDLRGGDFILRWKREFSTTSNLSLQAYYDYAFRAEALGSFTVHTEDLDLVYRFSPLERNDVSCGLGYRLYQSDVGPNFTLSSDPPRRTDDIPSAFVQDEITLVKDHLRLVLGSKFEHNEFSGFEYQPSGRLSWTIDDREMAWAAVSRAVRTPSIVDVDFRLNAAVLPTAPPTVVSLFGNPDFLSEELFAYEAGDRVRPIDPLSLDLALFYNDYRRLRSVEPGTPFLEANPPPAHLVVPLDFANKFKGQTGGVELATNFQAASWWLLQVNYSYLRMDLSPTDGSRDTTTAAGENLNPRHQVWIRSAMDLPENLTLDVMGRYVSELSAFPVKSYVESDVRVAWREPGRRFEAAIVGQNLVHDSHAESGQPAARSDIRRGGYASLTWRF